MNWTEGIKNIDWRPIGDFSLPVIVAYNDLWFSHRTLSTLFGVTKQNISIHINDLIASGLSSDSRELLVAQTEGSRTVSRRVRHFPFQIAHAIALKAQRYEELNYLVDLAHQESLLKPRYKVTPIKERNFAALLIGILKDLETVLPQYPIGPYIVDFFLPRSRVVVEFDERHHDRPGQRKRDSERQQFIEERLNARFVRVSQDLEIEGLNAVFRQLFATRNRR